MCIDIFTVRNKVLRGSLFGIMVSALVSDKYSVLKWLQALARVVRLVLIGRDKVYELIEVMFIIGSFLILVFSHYSQGQSGAALSAEKLRYCL